MKVVLGSRNQRFWLITLSLLITSTYMTLVTREYVAAHLASRAQLSSLQIAAKLEAGNAEYRHELGRYFELIARNPSAALEQYRLSVQLNPYVARYWFDLSAVLRLMSYTNEEKDAVEHAIRADPVTPGVAWEAANFYLVQGDTESALREFRVVLQNDPYLPYAALQLCWRANPDVDALLRKVVPPRVEAYLAFLDLLIDRKETAGAAKVWSALMKSTQRFEPVYLFRYVKYLVLQGEAEQARLVWQQASGILGLSSYLASPNNLIVNGTFGLDILNGGFDWQYLKQPGVSLALDPSAFHGGYRSLSITFDGPGVTDAGIYQFIAVQPNTEYEFSGYFKAGEIEGAGGPRFAIHDVYSTKTYFESDDLKDAEFWKPVNADFTTGPETKLLVLRVARVPAGSPIRGKLWIDDFQLVQKQSGSK